MASDLTTPADTTADPITDPITERVRARYATAAQRVLQAEGGCCTPQTLQSGCCSSDAFGADLSTGNYTADELATLPEEAVVASLGCGNPTALIDLHTGETVLDLGSGGGIDVLLSAQRVGPTGHDR
jgi:hypothetical protein